MALLQVPSKKMAGPVLMITEQLAIAVVIQILALTLNFGRTPEMRTPILQHKLPVQTVLQQTIRRFVQPVQGLVALVSQPSAIHFCQCVTSISRIPAFHRIMPVTLTTKLRMPVILA